MRVLDAHRRLGLYSADEVFGYLVGSLKASIFGADYYVDWDKAQDGRSRFVYEMGQLESLIGAADAGMRLSLILRSDPMVAPLLGMLIAKRMNSKDGILTVLQDGRTRDVNLSGKALSDQEIDSLVLFCRDSGLLQMLQTRQISSLADYLLGVEVGLDSNARKNRGGKAMEAVVSGYVQRAATSAEASWEEQVTASQIARKYAVQVPVDKAHRSFDFAVHHPSAGLTLIETNYYSGGGSKLKSVAGEFLELNRLVTSGRARVKFVWITDGAGWHTTTRPLRETFDRIDHTFNLALLDAGALDEVVRLDPQIPESAVVSI